jgi:hypothetical protein
VRSSDASSDMPPGRSLTWSEQYPATPRCRGVESGLPDRNSWEGSRLVPTLKNVWTAPRRQARGVYRRRFAIRGAGQADFTLTRSRRATSGGLILRSNNSAACICTTSRR